MGSRGKNVFEDISPIFIVGSSRSGTTLLQQILNSHRNIAVYGEVHYFNEIVQLKKDAPDLKKAEDMERFFRLLPERAYHVRHLPYSEDVLTKTRERLERSENPTYDLFFRILLEEFAQRKQAKRIGEKTNEHIRYLEEMFALFPRAKVVHIVRDPRDVVASMVGMPWASNDVVVNALRWRAEVRAAQRYRSEHRRYYELRYEDLIADPEGSIRKICEFVEEEFDPSMLQYHKEASRFIKDEPWKERTSTAIDSRAKERWRRELSPGQVALIQLITGRALKDAGFRREALSVGPWAGIPFTFMVEVAKYLRYKRRQRKERSGSDIIYGDDRTLYRLLVRSFWA